MKKLKKLELKKETIVHLNDSEMGDIVGGFTFDLMCYYYYQVSKNCGGASDACTRPPRCCNFGCCETLNC